MTDDMVKQQVRRRPPVVQQVLRIIATKHWVAAEERVPTYTGQESCLFAEALQEWDRWVATARQQAVDISESQLAEAIIAKLRREPQWGWDRILRGKAN